MSLQSLDNYFLDTLQSIYNQNYTMAAEEQRQKVLKLAQSRNVIRTRDVVGLLRVSRQYAKVLINDLVANGKLIKIGSTRSARYILTEYASQHLELFPSRVVRTLKNQDLEEHRVLDEVQNSLPMLLQLKENVRSILDYGFSEMLNNAIEHSESKRIKVEIEIRGKKLTFRVTDSGVGVFRNIMQKRGLKSELEAIQDLLKGKTTTQPRSHSGEGIFFTSKVADIFTLDSFGFKLIVNNLVNDVFVINPDKIKRGTEVSFTIETFSSRHLSNVFQKYADLAATGDLVGFDKTEIKIKLYTMGGVHVSRSQARRVLANLDKFKAVVFDFDKVPMIGQAFADEIFRVFHNKHPEIQLRAVNANDAVQFMIDRAGDRDPRTHNLFGRAT